MKGIWCYWCALTLVVSFAALGAEPEMEALRAQIEKLADRIKAQEKELSELKAQQGLLVEQLDKKTSAVAAPAPGVAPAYAEGGKSFADRIRVGGYGSVRFEAKDLAGAAKGFTFRRLVLTTDAQLTNRLQVHTETEFERLLGIEVEKSVAAMSGGLRVKQGIEGHNGGEIAIEQAWGQYNFAENHGLRAGVVLPPLGRFNLLHDDDYWDLPRRTLVDRDAPITPVKTAWRELGAGLVGGFHLGRAGKLDYQFYVLNGSTLDVNLESVAQTRNPPRNKLALEGEFRLSSGFFDGSQSARAISWRTTFSPSLTGEIALSGYHGRYTPTYLGISELVNSFGLDYKWRQRGLEIEGEAIYSSFGRTRRVMDALAQKAFRSKSETSSSETRQLESEIEFELAGLARTRWGFWTDFKYHWRPLWLKRTFLGRPFEDPRLIPILRYEHVWLNRNIEDLGFNNGVVTNFETDNLEQDRVSLGLSYRPVRNFGLQLSYEHNRRVNGGFLIFPRAPVKSTNGLVTGMVFSF